MDEEEKNKETDKEPEKDKQEAADDNSKERGKYETTPVIERAREEREKMDAANKKKEELLDREEQIMARKALGGGSEAGQAPVKKEETPVEYKNRIEKEGI